MKALVQRVSQASVCVEDETIASIGTGLLVLLGIQRGDAESDAGWLASRVAALRVFPSNVHEMDRSVCDIRGAVLVVSQFTLAGDVRKGNRPNFSDAAPPELAKPLVEEFIERLRERVKTVEAGVFGAHMHVELTNDGPVTLLLQHGP